MVWPSETEFRYSRDLGEEDVIDSPPHSALDARVLVLNRNYLAVHVVGVRRALNLLCREVAEVLEVCDGLYANYDFQGWLEMSELRSECKRADEDWIRSVHFELQAPRVVRLVRYDRVPRQSLRFSRRSLFARDGHECQYCGHRFPPQQLSLDHVVPRSRGGDTTWENIVCCCRDCNTRKGGRTPREASMTLKNPPRRPEHGPLLSRHIQHPKYESWRLFVAGTRIPLELH